jgi:hypothetical protein
MKNLKAITWALGLALAAGPVIIPTIATAQEGQWEPMEPQGQWSDAWHHGFHEGVEAARRDMRENRRTDMDDHEQYRHPNVPRDMRRDFREGFARGYHMVMEHNMHRDRDRDDRPGR